MDRKYLKNLNLAVPILVFSLSSQQALAAAVITSYAEYGEGIVSLTDIYGYSINDVDGSVSGGTVVFDQYSFPVSPTNLSTGVAGGSTTLDVYDDYHFFGDGGSSATIEDPLNQLDSIQMSGGSAVDFSFNL